MQIVILGLYTIGAHSLHFRNTKTFKIISFEFEKGEIPPYSELEHGLEQALDRIQQLEAAVQLFHSEYQSQLAAEAANHQI